MATLELNLLHLDTDFFIFSFYCVCSFRKGENTSSINEDYHYSLKVADFTVTFLNQLNITVTFL